MPKISSFYGIIIKMFFIQSEHNPPHIHAMYGEYMGSFEISTCKMYEGDLPVKAQELVTQWMEIYREELSEMWKTQEFHEIKGLE
jgi:hypothetical protein